MLLFKELKLPLVQAASGKPGAIQMGLSPCVRSLRRFSDGIEAQRLRHGASFDCYEFNEGFLSISRDLDNKELCLDESYHRHLSEQAAK